MKTNRWSSERGQAVVELALTLPIFMLIVFGMLDLGRAVYMSNNLAAIARDGARIATTRPQDCAATSASARAWPPAPHRHRSPGPSAPRGHPSRR